MEFASQKQYVALYVLKKDALVEFRGALPGSGKGCGRFTKPDRIDFDVVRQLLSRTAESKSAPC
jgi:hypothetical protein